MTMTWLELQPLLVRLSSRALIPPSSSFRLSGAGTGLAGRVVSHSVPDISGPGPSQSCWFYADPCPQHPVDGSQGRDRPSCFWVSVSAGPVVGHRDPDFCLISARGGRCLLAVGDRGPHQGPPPRGGSWGVSLSMAFLKVQIQETLAGSWYLGHRW